MPWFAVPVAVATIGLVSKLVSRHLHGQLGARAIEDPPGVRTIARFELADDGAAEPVLLAVAAELTHELGDHSRADHRIEVTGDAVRARAHPLSPRVDVVRLSRRGAATGVTLELTRAWTGATLDDTALALLLRIHEALLAHPEVRGLSWHARQDRELREGHVFPFDAPRAISR